MDEFHVLIRNMSALPAQYTISRQKEMAELLESAVFKVVPSTDTLSNIQILNFYFVDQVKHVGINNAHKKSQLVVQA